MGTRNLTIVIQNGKNVVAQYCQWDGYPDGQGRGILEFLRNGFNRAKFIQGLKATEVIEQKDIDRLYKTVLGYVPGQFIDMADSKKFALTYPSLGRDLGGKIIEFIQNREIDIREVDYSKDKFEERTVTVKATDVIPLSIATDFAKDTLFCEWIWTINLDENVFRGSDNGSMINEWSLDRLPTVKTFLKRFERSDEE